MERIVTDEEKKQNGQPAETATPTLEPIAEPPPDADKLPRAHYDIAVVFGCDETHGGCGTRNGIVDPKLVVVALRGAQVRLACQKCQKEWLIEPNPAFFQQRPQQRVVAPGSALNRQQRKALAKAQQAGLRLVQR